MKKVRYNTNTDPHRYDDMLDLQRPRSMKHKPMSMHDRAAQFSPFAALTGYEDVIDRTAVSERDKMLEKDSFHDEPPCYL